MDELLFLGTAGDSVVRARQLRSSAGILLKLEGFQFLIDPGEGTLPKFKEYNEDVLKTTLILVSHNHLGHCGDLNNVIDAITLGGFNHNGYLAAANGVINGSEGNRVLLDYCKDWLIKYIVLEPGQKLGVGDVEIEAKESKHTTKSIGFVIKTPKISIGYPSDTEFTQKIASQYEGVDILVLNVVSPGPIKSKGNLNVSQAINFVKAVKPKLVVITHFGIDMLKQGPLDEARNIEKNTSVQVVSAKDGMRLNLSDYENKFYQHKLDNYY